MKIRTPPPSRRCCNSVMLGRGQASSGLPGLPMAHSRARCRHRDFGSLSALPGQAQHRAWLGHHGAGSHFALPPGSPVSSRSGQKAGLGEYGSGTFSCDSCRGRIGGLAASAHLPCQAGTRYMLGQFRLHVHRHRWHITRWRAPSASHRPARQ